MILKKKDFATWRINWEDKFKNISNVRYQESIEQAIKSINLNQGDLLLITGSLYLCSEVLNLN